MEHYEQEPALDYSKHYTFEEFIQFTEKSEFRYEYWDGYIMAMPATTQAHAEITHNVNACLKEQLKPRGCKSFQTSIFLRIKNKNLLLLPDVQVTCNANDIAPNNIFVDNPSIIVEVLSEGTELYDIAKKWHKYMQIPSLRYYLMIQQTRPHVASYGRPNAQSLFYYQAFDELEATIELSEMEIFLSIGTIYDGIAFEQH